MSPLNPVAQELIIIITIIIIIKNIKHKSNWDGRGAWQKAMSPGYPVANKNY